MIWSNFCCAEESQLADDVEEMLAIPDAVSQIGNMMPGSGVRKACVDE